MKKRLTAALAALLVMATIGSSAFAFDDTAGDPNEAQIVALQKAGIVSGLSANLFAPKGKMTTAQGVAMLVKAFDLNIAHMQFIKEPKASDYFTNIPDDAWYAQSFLYAYLNGVPLPKDVDPSQRMTKEQFAHYLFHAMTAKGDYAFIEMFVMIKDEKDITKEYMNSIQKLILGKMTELDDGYFHPKNEITRSEAARMLHAAVEFAKHHEPVPKQPVEQPNIALTVTKVNDDVNKVTLSWGERPNPGYGISVTNIEFRDDGMAVISYALREPEPGKFYPQVISEAKVDTYIASSYKPVLNNPN
ncbi:protease complex subunit PrcB family protein [Paenibacillus sp. GYB003]|uniref:protease complex subunit PrcB family protein n=1 Tax=Paenibacillus sp. GYB003 TaxID=2994392 RepID=UPI002F962581